MNFQWTLISSLSLVLLALPSFASTQGTVTVEVPVEVALAPVKGFDNNDNVEIVLHGWLPNACYTIGNYTVETKPDSKVIKIHQFAIKQTDAYCAQEDSMPLHLKMAIPFTTEVSVGQLPVGEYQFEYESASGGSSSRNLIVDPATSPTVDSLPYAAVTNAMIPDVVSSKDDLIVTLTGILNSSCTELDDKVEVRGSKDVFIVLPIIKVKQGAICAQVIRPFERQVNLGKAVPGHYLVHVRSMNGKAVNRVIEVWR